MFLQELAQPLDVALEIGTHLCGCNMTRHNAISALAISPILVASFAQGIHGQTATNEAGGEKAPPIIACSLTSKDMGARADKLKTELYRVDLARRYGLS